jgi:hypothetical protein
VARSYSKAVKGGLDLGNHLQQARELLHNFRESPNPPEYAVRNHALLHAKKPWKLTLRAFISTFYHLAHSLGNFEERYERLSRSWFEAWTSWRKMMLGKNDFNKDFSAQHPFIFYPLHVDPEASTMVLSPWHTDQINVIEALAKSMPAKMLLVVKEHAPMLGKRPRGFYKTISRIPRVVLLGPEHNGLSLVQKASLVTVITGTAAWEAMRIGKPAIVIGDSPFLAVGEGVAHEPFLVNLPEAIHKAMLMQPASDRSLELYIAACLRESFDMKPSLMWGKYEDHTKEDREMVVSNIVDGILRREAESAEE